MSTSTKLRFVRRVRRVRRLHVRPRLVRLGQRLATVWGEPAGQSVAWRLERLAQSIEGATEAAGRMAGVGDRLSRDLERLADLPRPARPPAGGWAPSGALSPGSLPVALTLAVVAIALAAGNTWLLDRHLLPPVLESGAVAFGGVPTLYVAAVFSALALVLGAFQFTLFTTGKSWGLRLFGIVVGLLLAAQAGLQAAATAVAVQAWSGPVAGSWAAMGALALMAGAAGLVPPVVAATAHGGIDRIARWHRSREQRDADRVTAERDRVAARVERSARALSDGMAEMRAQAAMIPEGDVARLLAQPTPAPSVERLSLVLRRLALAAEREPGYERAPGRAGLRRLVDLAALGAWLVVAAASLYLTAPVIGPGRAAAIPGPIAAGATAGLLVLLVGGLALRLLLERPGRRADPRPGAAALLLTAFAAASLAMGFGRFVAAAHPFMPDALGASALLNLLVLTAALTSARLPEGIRAARDLLRLAVGALAWSVLAVADLALATLDRTMVGRRRAARPLAALHGRRDP